MPPRLQVWRPAISPRDWPGHPDYIGFPQDGGKGYKGIPCIHQIGGKAVLADCGCLCSCDLRGVFIRQAGNPFSYSALEFFTELAEFPMCGLSVRDNNIWHGKSVVEDRIFIDDVQYYYWFWSIGNSVDGIDFHFAWEMRLQPANSCSGFYGSTVINCPNDVQANFQGLIHSDPSHIDGLDTPDFVHAYRFTYDTGEPHPGRQFRLTW